MGFFSRLIRNVAGQVAEDAAVDAIHKAQRDAYQNSQHNNNNSSRPAAPSPSQSVSLSEPEGPSGFSWGPTMPQEPNQYNSGMPYEMYFAGIFQTNFPDYDVRLSRAEYTGLPLFTFVKNGSVALVVELFSKKSSAKKTRNKCKAQNIPYLRYYIDYEGWWNTREYVITRTRNNLAF